MTYKSKHLLMFSLLLTAGLAGCIEEQFVEPRKSEQRPVVFATQVSSRAATGHPIENGAAIPVGDYHFGVYAWVKPTAAGPVEPFDELQNAKVEHASASEYTYDPVASWPRNADATLACMAYYPWSDNSGNIKVTPGTGANQTMTIEYTIPSSSADHVDLMYARTDMTPGYDPVNLDFRHALARLKFEGRTEDFPADATVKITGIRITNAVMKGDLVVLDPVSQTGKPPWELSTVPADKGAITMPVTHIKDLTLTQTLQSVITPGGDMLVIPQSVDGLTVEVTATLNGTAFPEPFVFSLTSSPEWTMNEIITYEITLMPDGMHLSANVTDWTTDPVSVIHDGQWWLSVNGDNIELDPNGDEFTLNAETNYNINSQGYSAGLQINAAEISYISGGDGWLTLTNMAGANGGPSRTIKFAVEPNTTRDDRLAKLYVRAGNLTKVINISQVSNRPGVRIFEYINGAKGEEIDALEFIANGEAQVDAQSFIVEWSPKDATLNIATTANSHQSAFVYEASSNQITAGTYSDVSGTQVYTIQPGALATNANPLYEQGFTATFSITVDGSPETAELDVRHYNRNAVIEKERIYLLDGSSDHSFTVKSNVEWTAYYVRQEVTSGISKQFITEMDGQAVLMDNSASPILVGSGGHNLKEGGTRINFSVIDEINLNPEPEAYLGDGYILVVAGVDESDNKYFEDKSDNLYCASAVPVGESNCYMINSNNPIPILIPVSQLQYAMNGDVSVRSGFIGRNWISPTNADKLKVQVLWSDVNKFGTPDAVVMSLIYIGANPVINSKIVVIPGSGIGNAGIILYEDANNDGVYNGADVIRWSWHIWNSTYFPYAAGTYPSKKPTVSAVWMDRNMGATTNTYVAANPQKVVGFFYQWGRKDPFPSVSAWNTTFANYLYYAQSVPASSQFREITHSSSPNLTNAVQYPLTRYFSTGDPYDWFSTASNQQNNDLWGGGPESPAFLHAAVNGIRKSVYDPCPEGYRMPKNGEWTGSAGANGWASSVGTSGANINGQYNANYGGYYPAAGLRNYNNVGLNYTNNFYGYYWTSTTKYGLFNLGDNLYFRNSVVTVSNQNYRAFGYAVRCHAE